MLIKGADCAARCDEASQTCQQALPQPPDAQTNIVTLSAPTQAALQTLTSKEANLVGKRRRRPKKSIEDRNAAEKRLKLLGIRKNGSARSSFGCVPISELGLRRTELPPAQTQKRITQLLQQKRGRRGRKRNWKKFESKDTGNSDGGKKTTYTSPFLSEEMETKAWYEREIESGMELSLDDVVEEFILTLESKVWDLEKNETSTDASLKMSSKS